MWECERVSRMQVIYFSDAGMAVVPCECECRIRVLILCGGDACLLYLSSSGFLGTGI